MWQIDMAVCNDQLAKFLYYVIMEKKSSVYWQNIRETDACDIQFRVNESESNSNHWRKRTSPQSRHLTNNKTDIKHELKPADVLPRAWEYNAKKFKMFNEEKDIESIEESEMKIQAKMWI